MMRKPHSTPASANGRSRLLLPYRWNVDLLSISDLRCPIEPRNVCLGRQPAGGINRLSHPRAVLETISTPGDTTAPSTST